MISKFRIDYRRYELETSPVNGRCSPVLGQDGGVIDDGAMFRIVDDIHGNELGTEGQHIQLSTKGLVLLKHLNGGVEESIGILTYKSSC